MTGTDRIKEKILDDARAKAKAIQDQAENEAKKIMDQASSEAEIERTELLNKARAEGLQLYNRMLAVAGLDGRKKLLAAKQQMISTAFAKAMEKVCGMPDRQYQQLLENMIAEAAGDTAGEVLLSEKDAGRMDKDFVNNINQRISQAGKKGVVSLSGQHVKSVGGFILKHGDKEINSTFEILFGMLRNELESDVVSILFDS
jgi:V/A-type H+-transporting ATPase subunit E